MKIVAFIAESQAEGRASPFVDGDWRDPVPERPRDLLVRVHAVSVNPRDLKSRKAFPASLDHRTAAALPLVSLTAYEMLFDQLALGSDQGPGALLVLGGAGGVPTMAIQLARALTGLTIIGSASRPESEVQGGLSGRIVLSTTVAR